MQYLSPSQCRAARALLDWSQPELAKQSSVHVQTISAFENETGTPTKSTLEKIMTAFEKAGIAFTKEDGVKRSALITKTYHGTSGFIEFKNLVYETARDYGGDICVSNVDEAFFVLKLGDKEIDADKEYMQKMSKIKNNFSFKILIKEGDKNLLASDYAEYRWVKKQDFHEVPFYVFGDYLAFLIFEERTTIHLIHNAKIADAQRAQFNMSWERALPIK